MEIPKPKEWIIISKKTKGGIFNGLAPDDYIPEKDEPNVEDALRIVADMERRTPGPGKENGTVESTQPER